jgi:hypothetical protein
MAGQALEGGEKLKAYLEKLGQQITKKATLNVGFLAGATYPTGMPVAAVAAIQEFGAPRASIPPRPYFRTMVKAESPHWGPDLGKLLKANKFDASRALALLGEQIRGELQQSIVDTNTPSLSPVTLMLRKMKSDNQALVVTGRVVGEAAARVAAGESAGGVSTKPLVDSGHLLDSVDFEVI